MDTRLKDTKTFGPLLCHVLAALLEVVQRKAAPVWRLGEEGAVGRRSSHGSRHDDEEENSEQPGLSPTSKDQDAVQRPPLHKA
jgi:hypothetical protein